MFLQPAEYRKQIMDVTSGVVDRYLAGEIRQVHLAYNYFHSPIRQEPMFQQLLPVPPLEADQAGSESREMLFEPAREEILDHLLPAFLRNQTYVAHLNTVAGEHGARMVAMEGATKNAGEMINRLTLTYNRARQAAITKELIEIVNAAQAM
jgi:F-type H+-transporting ATPase subunit gamma